MRYFSSDIHAFHKRILEFCPNRKCKTIEEHNELIVNNFNSILTNQDETYHLGDFSFGDIIQTERFLRRLNGKHHLVIGNHDKFSWEDYIRIGFKTVCKFMFIKIGKVGPVGLAHDPCNCICAPSIPWLAGHLHYNFITFGNAINVGVDVRDMKPISEIDLMEDFNKVKINKKYKPEGITEILGRD